MQAAVKYCVKVVQISHRFGAQIRYKITYNNIVYITDETCTREVTCYAEVQLPLEKFMIYDSMARQFFEQKRRLREKIVSYTSHTVIIVDQSASMNEGDALRHGSIANKMIGQLLVHDQMSYTDVVTVTEMRTYSTVNDLIFMEPVTWELHNNLVDLAEIPLRGRGRENHIPALFLALQVLNLTDSPDCGLSLLFLSDGRPSDTQYRWTSPVEVRILEHVKDICNKFSKRLTFGIFGFASDYKNKDMLALLKKTTEFAIMFGCNGVFASGLDTLSLRKALYKMSTSLLLTKSIQSIITCWWLCSQS